MARRTSVRAALASSSSGDCSPPTWWPGEMQQMDEAFRKAVLAAVRDGSEHCATVPSKRLGTRFPVNLLSIKSLVKFISPPRPAMPESGELYAHKESLFMPRGLMLT